MWTSRAKFQGDNRSQFQLGRPTYHNFKFPLTLLPSYAASSAPNKMIFGPLTRQHALVLQRRLSTSQRSSGAPVHRIPKPEGEDFRPPWVYLMSRLVSLTVIPGTFVFCFYPKRPYELYSGRVLLCIFLRLWRSRACFPTGVCYQMQFSIWADVLSI